MVYPYDGILGSHQNGVLIFKYSNYSLLIYQGNIYDTMLS